MDAMTIAAIAMQNEQQRMSSISQNLVNVGTPAYKREVTVGQPFAAHLAGAVASGGKPAIDTSAGTLRSTGNPLDLAVEGAAWFEVQTAGGSAYTRQGAMRVDERGRIVTLNGDPLQGSSGDLVVTNAALAISGDGEITQGERRVGKIRLVRFANPERLQRLGNGLFAIGNAQLQAGPDGAKVRSGYLENSNVNSAQEMVRMSETVRQYEALQKVMQGYDDAYQKALRKLGDF